MRTTLLIVAVALLVQGSPSDRAITPTRVTALFNGRDLAGWTADVPEKDSNPQARDSFIVRDGMLVSLGTPPGHLLTNSSYQNYRLEVEYRFPGKPGNCGVLVHASRLRALYKMFPQSTRACFMERACGSTSRCASTRLCTCALNSPSTRSCRSGGLRLALQP
jgi:hypothetical protein